MHAQPKKVLIAGATGYLGGYIALECKHRGYWVRALRRSTGKRNGLLAAVDEIATGEVTKPESLKNLCQGIDEVFSSIGITRQKDGLTFRDVDYRGNLNLLREAKRAGVKKFTYVSVFNGPNLLQLDIVRAHEDFVQQLKGSGLAYTIIRPTGYFSDMANFLKMARQGRVWLIGSGKNKMNPIHGEDLAKVCVDALESDETEVNVGGPEVMTYRQIAETAFAALDEPAKINSVPGWLMKSIVSLSKIFNRHQGELLAFFTTEMLSDVVAPRRGSHRLLDHYRHLVAE